MPLLGRLLAEHPAEAGQYVVLADDDVELSTRWGGRFPALARAACLDFAMPAHAPGSAHTFRVTQQRATTTARLTEFVEIGPLVLLSPRAVARVVPFPAEARMGWGLDVAWSLLLRDGLRLGVVDATPMRHLGAVGVAYDQEFERAELERSCRAAGVESAYDMARETGQVWRPWQRRPAWAPDPTTGR